MGFFSGMTTEAYDRTYSDRDLVKRILHYFRPYMKQLLWTGFYLIIIAVAAAGIPIYVSQSLDEVGESVSFEFILIFAVVVFALGFAIWLANWARRRLLARVIGDVVMDIRLDGFRSAAAHDLSFYDEFSSGKVVSRITSDTREFGDVIVLITDLISQVSTALILVFILLGINQELSNYLFAYMPLVFLVSVGFRRIARRVTSRGMRAMGNVNAAIKETVSGIAVAKNFRQEEGIFGEFDEANQSSFDVNLRRMRWQAWARQCCFTLAVYQWPTL
jgi:ATP-binding cassette subfamily B protein